MFVRSAGVWSQQQQQLTDSGGASGDRFGISVALSGSTALVGADGTNGSTGAAYVFVRSAGVWSQQPELTASDGAAGDSFGVSAALSGSTALTSAYYRNAHTGAAYLSALP